MSIPIREFKGKWGQRQKILKACKAAHAAKDWALLASKKSELKQATTDCYKKATESSDPVCAELAREALANR